MGDDPVTIFFNLLKEQGALVTGLGVLVWLAGKWFIKQDARKVALEDAREARYNALIDSSLATAKEQTTSVVTALINNTAVMQRVERKLSDE